VIALVGDCEPGESAYLAPGHTGWGDPRSWERSWSWRGALRSVKWRGTGAMIKNWALFNEHGSVAAMTDLLGEIESRGIHSMPSGYGDLFHRQHSTPPTQAHVRKMFPQIPGSWEMALQSGDIRQPLYQYDIRSAYLWALSQHLPAPESFVTVKRVAGPGLYLIDSPARAGAPYPWYIPGRFPATEEEISGLNLPHKTVDWGISYEPGTWRCDRWVSDIQQWSCWKAVGRAFWGRWATSGRTKQTTYADDGIIRTESEIRDPCGNPVWAAIITSRIRLRLWEICWRQPVLRVYTDSVVTTAPLEEGEKLGDWREVKYFPRGGYVTTQHVLGDYQERAA
jgi:hypothetical protein